MCVSRHLEGLSKRGMSSSCSELHHQEWASLTSQCFPSRECLMVMVTWNQHDSAISAQAPTQEPMGKAKDNFYSDLEKSPSTIQKEACSSFWRLQCQVEKRCNPPPRHWAGMVKVCIKRANMGDICDTSPDKMPETQSCCNNRATSSENKHYITWQHRQSKHWHLLDYIIIPTRDCKDVLT